MCSVTGVRSIGSFISLEISEKEEKRMRLNILMTMARF